MDGRIEYIRFLEKAASGQRTAQRFHIGLAVGVVLLGLLAIVAAQIFASDTGKWLITLGGTFVSTLATFPIREISNRRVKILAVEFLLDGFHRLQERRDAASGNEASLLTERFWRLVDTSLGT
jgi:hypothetical protein